MDFSRILNNATSAVNQQITNKLLNNNLLRDAALKPQTDTQNNKQSPSTGLENLMNQLSATLTQQMGPQALNALNDSSMLKSLLNYLKPDALAKAVPYLEQMGTDTLAGVEDILSQVDCKTLGKLKSFLNDLSPEAVAKGVKFLQLMFGRDDRLFYQNENRDNNFNAVNQAKVSGADLDNFLKTAYRVYRAGGDMEKFIDASMNVMEKGDYDDFRRFLSVTEMVVYRKENLEDYYDFSAEMLEKSPHDYEGNIFSLYTTLAYGGRMDDHRKIVSNLQTTGFEGRNNMVDFNRITIDFRNQGGYLPVLFSSMAREASRPGGDVRAWMDKYMQTHGLRDTRPDFSKFDRIERIDGDPMVIKQGESAALFAQAISSRDGLLPESVLYWSSQEEGALDHGSSYLDLSKLGVGVHHIAVKIGGYGGGTDTAIKTVIVEPADDDDGTTKTHEDHGHGNDADGIDEDNPGNSGGTSRGREPAVDDPNMVPLPATGTRFGNITRTASPPTSTPSTQPGTVTQEVPTPAYTPPVSTGRGRNPEPSTPVAAPPPASQSPAADLVKDLEYALAKTNEALAALPPVADNSGRGRGRSTTPPPVVDLSYILNDKYYRSLDRLMNDNNNYVQILQQQLSDQRERTNDLGNVLNKILNTLQSLDPK